MDAPNLLDGDEFLSCFAQPMRNVTAEANAQINIWPYVEALDLSSSGITEVLDVAHVYRGADDAYEQVLIETDKFNSMLVIVIDLRSTAIRGYCVLDLNREYGLT
jgi:hypothetical protein